MRVNSAHTIISLISHGEFHLSSGQKGCDEELGPSGKYVPTPSYFFGDCVEAMQNFHYVHKPLALVPRACLEATIRRGTYPLSKHGYVLVSVIEREGERERE